MFANPSKIVEQLKDPSAVLTPIFSIIALKVFNWILLAAFTGSLFLVGKTLQNSKADFNENAKVTGDDAKLLAMEVMENVKAVSLPKARDAQMSIRRVYERLKNESDFGVGNHAVINCENEIVACLRAIENEIPRLYDEDTVSEAVKNINTLCQKINSKLNIRIQMKKK